MSTLNPRRGRLERVSAIELPTQRIARVVSQLQRPEVLLRLGLCLLTAAAIWLVTGSWGPPFGYQQGHVPPRDIVARVEFREFDQRATEDARERARSQVRYVYVNDVEPLAQLRAALQRRIVEITSAETIAELDSGVWAEFEPPSEAGAPPPAPEQLEADFQRFRSTMSGDNALATFEKSLTDALAPFERRGLMTRLPQELDKGNQKEIFVHLVGQPTERQLVEITEVLVGDGSAIEKALKTSFSSEQLAQRAYHWLRPRLPSTLRLNAAETERARDNAAESIEDQYEAYEVGDTLALGGKPLSPSDLAVLRLEHDQFLSQRSWAEWTWYSLAVLAVIGALFIVCGAYVVTRQPRMLRFNAFGTMMIVIVLTVAFGRWASVYWRAELIPHLFFGMAVAITYNQELALLLSTAVAAVMVTTLGVGPVFGEFMVLSGVSASAILLLARVRTRSKLINVGLMASVVAFLLTLAAGIIEAQPLGLQLATVAAANALWAFMTGFLIAGLSSPIESLFGVLTDVGLLEWGDMAQPGLQRLIRDAPGTYNHSINVAAIAEAAAESIGARGLLVRVGAYYHDLGKALKPHYFTENIGRDGVNRHDELMPAMSTLIIIGHVKDGVDLAREEYQLPQPLIDFIEQHHGTTLVEYFYHRANQNNEEDGEAVDENSFRYPGPKPQTKEAAVLMVADAVESASRALPEPTTERIESLVHDIAMKRLLDGQFDECGLTLSELRTVQDSLVKSLTAMYHGRVKYPSQRSA